MNLWRNIIKAVILAGGLGTRLSEETHLKPKPMVEIGGMPIIWHIMKIYSFHGINDFVICGGYKSHIIKEFFYNYRLNKSDITLDYRNNDILYSEDETEPWKVTIVNTGENTLTGGRLKRIKEYIKDEEFFFFTYGDGLGDIDITESMKFHKKHGGLATVTVSSPPGRFGTIQKNVNSLVTSFNEKPINEGGLINAGFFVLSPRVLDYIEGDNISWEIDPLEKLVKEKELFSFEHSGFWHPMDTLRDKNLLQNLWDNNKAPWKKWSKT